MTTRFPVATLALAAPARSKLLNRSGSDVLYLEIGDRSPGDSATYPDDDIEARVDARGKWAFTRKDGTPY